MRCGTCNYPRVEKTTTIVDEWKNNQLIAVRNVPVEKCPQCGEEYFSPQALKVLEKIMDFANEPVDKISVPVFEYQLLVA